MAQIRYFNGTRQLKGMYGMDNDQFAQMFPGVKGRRYDGYSKMVGYPIEGNEGPMPVERTIEYKANPSKHVCDARCLSANGKVMRCECSCGGINHGRGVFSALLA